MENAVFILALCSKVAVFTLFGSVITSHMHLYLVDVAVKVFYVLLATN